MQFQISSRLRGQTLICTLVHGCPFLDLIKGEVIKVFDDIDGHLVNFGDDDTSCT